MPHGKQRGRAEENTITIARQDSVQDGASELSGKEVAAMKGSVALER